LERTLKNGGTKPILKPYQGMPIQAKKKKVPAKPLVPGLKPLKLKEPKSNWRLFLEVQIMVLIEGANWSKGYEDKNTLKRRADKMREWLNNPTLLEADKDAKYKAVIEIDLNEITEPILACPNDPDDVKTLSEIHEQGMKTDIDEVFVGSCMTNIGLFRALGEVSM